MPVIKCEVVQKLWVSFLRLMGIFRSWARVRSLKAGRVDRLSREALVIASFGNEWSKFTNEIGDDQKKMFDDYFSIFPWSSLPANAVGCDIGCGSGRFGYFVAQRVGALHCADPSAEALAVARHKLEGVGNCSFREEKADSLSVPDNSLDFAYSLGVLHHVNDTLGALRHCVSKLKPGAPFLLYLYYRLENRPLWFRALWKLTDIPRRVISSLPFKLKSIICEVIAATIYWPLARTAGWLEKRGYNVSGFPLSYYRDKSFYIQRNDALDRFGTTLEKRFTRAEMETLMLEAGLCDICFREAAPFWTAVGTKRT